MCRLLDLCFANLGASRRSNSNPVLMACHDDGETKINIDPIAVPIITYLSITISGFFVHFFRGPWLSSLARASTVRFGAQTIRQNCEGGLIS